MFEFKQKKIHPSQKHRNSHCFILYKKTLDNVVKSLQKNPLSTKKIQHNKQVQNVYFEMKMNHNSQKNKNFYSNNALQDKKQKNHILKNPFHLIVKTQRTRSHSHKKGHYLFLFRHHNDHNLNKESPVNKASTKNSSSTQYETELIKQLKKQIDFYKYKCFQSEQKLNKLQQRFHQQKKTNNVEKHSYEEKVRRLVKSPQISQKQSFKSMTFKRTIQGKRSHEDIGFRHLHKLKSGNGEDETQRHSQSIHSQQFIGKKVVS